ncbi:MAG: hypothetical protein KAI47_11170, partial [Deltaproteobacteria bacterium]|nr:hypothetical protein [Deltaproteobacteria bacterium]
MSCPWVSRSMVAVVAVVTVTSLVATPALARRPGRVVSASPVLRMRAPASPELTSSSGLASPATKAPPA